MQGRGCLVHSTISFGHENSGQLTGFGRETGNIPPSGGILWAQVPTIEGSEDGGDRQAGSGRERGHPRLRQLLMHLRGKRHQSKKPIIQPRGLRTGRSVDIQPDNHGCLGKHGCQLWVRCGGGDNTRGVELCRTFILRGRKPIPDAAIDILSSDGAPNEMLAIPWDEPAKSPGNRMGRSLREE